MATRPIDEKIVAMKMDNSDFAKKAAETTSIFGKLRNVFSKGADINFDRTAKSLSDIQRTADRTDLSGIQRSVDRVGMGFSKLEIMATTALVNITNRAVNAGIALQRSLGPEQMADGFREYEMKIGSIGTMLANTKWAGTGLDEVKETLNELNDYADRTIYNFAQMTQNIGRFTAAGVTLGDSTIAIKGLGNLAAVSGSTSEQLNTAMYQMSQALSSGKLTLMDWNSMINAGMGGKMTQDALVDTARAMGIAVDLSEGFRNSIQDGWLTSEVLLETLKKFGADESMTEAATKVRTFTQMMSTLKEGIGSGWAETWELIFGDFEEATLLWTTLSEIIQRPFAAMTKSRNDFLKELIDSGTIEQTIMSIMNVSKPIISIFRAIGDGFKLAFPPMGIDTIVNLVKSFAEFTKGLLLSETSLDAITKVSHGVFAIFSSVWEIVKGLTQAVFGLLPHLKEVGVVILGVLAWISNLSIAFNGSIKSGTLFADVMGVIGVALDYIGKGLDWVTDKLKVAGRFFGMSFEGDAISETNKELLTMRDVLAPIGTFFKGVFDTVVVGFEWVKEKLVGFGQAIKDALPSGEKLFAGGFLAAMATIVGFTLKMAWDLYEVFTGWGKIGTGVADVLEGVGDSLNAFSWQVRAQALVTIAIGVGLLAASLFALSRIKPEKLTTGLIAMTTILTAVIGGMAIMTKYDIAGAGMKAALQMVAMGMAVAVMAGALKLLSLMDTDEILRGILGLTGIMVALSGAVVLMSMTGGAKIGATALQITALALSMHVMISAIKRISEIDTGDLVKGVTTLGVVLAQMGIFFRLAGKSSFGIGSTLGMLAVGQAIINITNAINKIAEIDVKNLVVGLTTIGLILAAIAAFTVITSDKGLFTTGLGMMIIAGALTALVAPIALLGSMDVKQLAIGMGAMAVALLAIGAASLLMKNMVATGAGLMLVAAALHMFIIPIAMLSAMSWSAILTGIGGLALGLVTIGGVSALLGLAAGYIAAFGAALAIVGVAMLAAGAGMALFSSGLVMLTTMTAASITTIVATFGTLLVGLASMIPTAVDFIVKLFMQLIAAISREVPNIVGLFAKMLTNILLKIGEYIPKIVEAAVKIITNFLDALAQKLPEIVESAANLMVAFVDSLAAAVELKGPEFLAAIMRLMAAAANLIVDAGVAVVNALFGWIPGVSDATDKIGKKAEEAIRKAFDIETAAEDKGEDFIKGMENKSNNIEKAGETIAKSGKQGVESVDVRPSGEYFGQGFANGIDSSSNRSKVSSAAQNLANIAQNEIKTTLDIRSPARETTKLGAYTGEGFANGISSTSDKAAGSANSIAGAIMNALGIKSETPKKATKGGEKVSSSYAKGVSSKKSKSKAGSAARSVAKTVTDEFRKAMDEAKYKLEMEEIDAEKYLAELKRIRSAYAKNADQIKEVNREIKRAEEDLERKRDELRKKAFEKNKEAITNRKQYNDISLKQELEAWQRIQTRYMEGTEERKEADREVYRLKNEINDKLIALNEEYVSKVEEANKRLIEGERELNEEYENAVADRAKELSGFAGIFDEVTKASDVSGEKLLNNLKSQVLTFMEWQNAIKSLSYRGVVDNELLDELRDMGPRAAAEIAALNTLTDQQLSEYSRLWKTKNELAHNQAVEELDGLKKDTISKIEELRNQTASELETYKEEWLAKIKEIRYGTADEFVDMNTTMHTIGRDTIRGLMSGMDNMRGPLMSQAKSIANSVSKTIREALKIKSPSRVLMGLGEFAGEGLAVGIANSSSSVEGSARDLATTAQDSLNKFLTGFELPEEDSELHFKAVIDYDSFDTSRFGNVGSIQVRPDTSFTNGLISATKADLRQNGSKTPSGNSNTSKNETGNNKESNQPIVIQSVLNGRVIAEETFDDVNRLLARRTGLDYVMGG